MNIRFDGKRALVTGAGRGIGRGIVKKLAECGAECLALSKTPENLESLKNEMPEIQTIMVDLADWTATRHALENVGKIDLLVNNAAIMIMSPFLETAKDDLDKVLDVNFKAVFNISQIVARGMVERGDGGAIVNVSSILSRRAVRNAASYCSSKGAMDSLTQVMANELGSHKIRVNSVHPHLIPSTEMGNSIAVTLPPGAQEYVLTRTPLGRFPDVEDVVNAVVFLLSDKASSINGIALPIEGGYEAN
ncbi:hypothetical protein CHS0354_031773 [Potamilus streckersoni]|uniref:L-xylulose reductase n=1 Tax=Potamilus streckersoni TaxID=2493646 RepID=A0AAE0RXU9_9BIVA|nr:hypothetical protein CHS0354_031773 [Potamilus streckersoni]